MKTKNKMKQPSKDPSESREGARRHEIIPWWGGVSSGKGSALDSCCFPPNLEVESGADWTDLLLTHTGTVIFDHSGSPVGRGE